MINSTLATNTLLLKKQIITTANIHIFVISRYLYCVDKTVCILTITLEDLYGLTVSESDEDICLKVDTSKDKDAHELWKMLYAWKEQADKLSSEEISKDKYDEWRYHYPEFDTTQTWAKVPSQALSDTLVEMFQDKLKPDK